jgi:hypothetical protein
LSIEPGWKSLNFLRNRNKQISNEIEEIETLSKGGSNGGSISKPAGSNKKAEVIEIKIPTLTGYRLSIMNTIRGHEKRAM